MPQIDNHLKWCLKDTRRLVKVKPDLDLAQKHVKKSEYNYGVLQTLEKLKIYDWALSVGFYSIYHCFLAILRKFGYESRNQECTVAVIEMLQEQGKIKIDSKLINSLKIMPTDEQTIIKIREKEKEKTKLSFKK